MIVSAKLKYLRIAPRKVRLVADLIRGKSVEESQRILNFTPKRASHPLFKLLKSAIANAKNNFQIEEKNLYISKIFVDEGPKLKRWHPQSRGRAAEIQKKSSHIFIELSEIKKVSKKIKKVKKPVSAPSAKKKIEEKKDLEKAPKITKPKPELKKEIPVPKLKQSIKKVFRRKAF